MADQSEDRAQRFRESNASRGGDKPNRFAPPAWWGNQLERSVVVLGVQGSGKTVFLSVLGHAFEEDVGAFGLQLTGSLENSTRDYVNGVYRLMRQENEFPPSTDDTARTELSWSVKNGTRRLFTLESIDCAGETIVKALAPSRLEKGKNASGTVGRKNGEKQVDAAFENLDDVEDDSLGDVCDMIRKRVKEADVVCLFLNPDDFEKHIVDAGDDFGDIDYIRKANMRSDDMSRLLLTILDTDAAAGKRIILTITQTGAANVAGRIEELGGAKAYLFDQNGQLQSLERAAEANVIAVSAVNETVWKSNSGETVEPLDENRDEKRVQGRSWNRRRDGERRFVPREYPNLDVENPSSGMVEFLISVGGPLCVELRPLDDALQALRARQYDYAVARHDENASEKARLVAARKLDECWQGYQKAAKEYMASHLAQSAAKARAKTLRHLAEMEAPVIRWIVAEPIIDAALRDAVAKGETMPSDSFVGEVAQRVNAAVDAAAAEYLGQAPDGLFKHVVSDDLKLTPSWLRAQFAEYAARQRDFAQQIETALKQGKPETASSLIARLRGEGWYPDGDARFVDWDRRADAMTDRKKAREELFAQTEKAIAEAVESVREGEQALSRTKENLVPWKNAALVVREKADAASSAIDRAAEFLDILSRDDEGNALFGDEMRVADITADLNDVRDGLNALEDDIVCWETEVAAAARRRRLAVTVLVSLSAVTYLSIWLIFRLQMTGIRHEAISLARQNQFTAARNRLGTMPDHPFFFLRKRDFASEELLARWDQLEEYGIKRGKAETERAAVDDTLAAITGKYGSDESRLLALSNDTWKEYKNQRAKADALFPKVKVDKYGCPNEGEDLNAAYASYDEAAAAYREAKSQLNLVSNQMAIACGKFRTARKTAQDMWAKLDERKTNLVGKAVQKGVDITVLSESVAFTQALSAVIMPNFKDDDYGLPMCDQPIPKITSSYLAAQRAMDAAQSKMEKWEQAAKGAFRRSDAEAAFANIKNNFTVSLADWPAATGALQRARSGLIDTNDVEAVWNGVVRAGKPVGGGLPTREEWNKASAALERITSLGSDAPKEAKQFVANWQPLCDAALEVHAEVDRRAMLAAVTKKVRHLVGEKKWSEAMDSITSNSNSLRLATERGEFQKLEALVITGAVTEVKEAYDDGNLADVATKCGFGNPVLVDTVCKALSDLLKSKYPEEVSDNFDVEKFKTDIEMLDRLSEECPMPDEQGASYLRTVCFIRAKRWCSQWLYVAMGAVNDAEKQAKSRTDVTSAWNSCKKAEAFLGKVFALAEYGKGRGLASFSEILRKAEDLRGRMPCMLRVSATKDGQPVGVKVSDIRRTLRNAHLTMDGSAVTVFIASFKAEQKDENIRVNVAVADHSGKNKKLEVVQLKNGTLDLSLEF